MKTPQEALLGLLAINEAAVSIFDRSGFHESAITSISMLSSKDIAHVYVEVGLLGTFLTFIKEQLWLKKKEQPNDQLKFGDFMFTFLKTELSLMAHVHNFLRQSSPNELKVLKFKTFEIEKIIFEIIKGRSYQERKLFSTQTLILLTAIFTLEAKNESEKLRQGKPPGMNLYRTYDGLDEVFDLTYGRENGMKIDPHNTECLYEGSGVGVQSGYSTILTALYYLNPPPGSRFIDLGSGYGRIGLTVGLVRPDLNFIGYEYVQHRVDSAIATVDKFKLQKHVQFYNQDLSATEFMIPEATTYYMYDPFCEKTYKHVLSQLVAISQRQKISIVTKGNARLWLKDVGQQHGWPSPQIFDNGNLCIFLSPWIRPR
jgi:hypothetical protein